MTVIFVSLCTWKNSWKMQGGLWLCICHDILYITTNLRFVLL